MGAVLIALTRWDSQTEGAATVSDAASASADKASSQAHASSETFHLEVTHFTTQHSHMATSNIAGGGIWSYLHMLGRREWVFVNSPND